MRWTEWCGTLFVFSIWANCISAAPPVDLAESQADRFDLDGFELRDWISLLEVSEEYEQLRLTSNQCDALFEVRQEWIQRQRARRGLGDSNAYHRELLVRTYQVLEDWQDHRLDQMLFQQWMNRGNLEPAIRAFASDVDIPRLKQKLYALQKKLRANLRDSGLKRKDAFHHDFKKNLAKLQVIQWQEQMGWLEEHLGKERVANLVGEPYPAPMVIQFGKRNKITGQPANPTTGEIVQTRTKRPVTIPEGWTLADAEHALREKYIEIEHNYDEFRQRAGQEQERANAEREREIAVKRAAQFQPRPPGQMGGGMMGGMGGMMGGMVGGMMGGFGELNSSIRFEVFDYNERARFELYKLNRIIEELGGDPRAESREIANAQREFMPRWSWPWSCTSEIFQSHVDANATQCDHLDAMGERYEHELGLVRKRPEKMAELQANFERELFQTLDKKQKLAAKQLRFRRAWFSANPEMAFAKTKLQLTDEHREKIRDVAAEFKNLAESSLSRGRASFGAMMYLRPPEREWPELKKAFEDVLGEIVGRERVPVFLGDPIERNPGWVRPVVVTSGMSLLQAQQNYDTKVQALNNLRDKLGRADYAVDRELMRDKPNDQRISELDRRSAGYNSRLRKLRKEVKLAKRVLEELGGMPVE